MIRRIACMLLTATLMFGTNVVLAESRLQSDLKKDSKYLFVVSAESGSLKHIQGGCMS